MDFVGQSSLRWGGVEGEQLFFDGVRVTEGTHPPKSMWSKVMIHPATEPLTEACFRVTTQLDFVADR